MSLALNKNSKFLSVIIISSKQETTQDLNSILKDIVRSVQSFNAPKESIDYLNSHRVDIIYLEKTNIDLDLKIIQKIKSVFYKTSIVYIDNELLNENIYLFTNYGVTYFIKDITDDEVKKSLEFPVRLFISDKKNSNLYSNIKKLFDYQKSLVVVVQNEKIIDANGRFFDFFGIRKKNEFISKIDHIGKLFVKKDGYLSISNSENIFNFINNIPLENRKVVMCGESGVQEIFSLDIIKLSKEDEKLLITFFNITPLEKSKKIGDEEQKDVKAYSWQKVLEALEVEYHRSKRYNIELSLIMLSITKIGFKDSVALHNDRTFKIVEKLILKMIRPTDFFGQLGIGIFVLVAPHTSFTNVRNVVERLLALIKANHLISNEDYIFNFVATHLKENDKPLNMLKRVSNKINAIKDNSTNSGITDV